MKFLFTALGLLAVFVSSCEKISGSGYTLKGKLYQKCGVPARNVPLVLEGTSLVNNKPEATCTTDDEGNYSFSG